VSHFYSALSIAAGRRSGQFDQQKNFMCIINSNQADSSMLVRPAPGIGDSTASFHEVSYEETRVRMGGMVSGVRSLCSESEQINLRDKSMGLLGLRYSVRRQFRCNFRIVCSVFFQPFY
jgi:hypothetical protein